MEKKKIGQIQGRISRRLVCNPTNNICSSICIPNMTTLACMIVEKFLTKNLRREGGGWKDGQNDEGTEGRVDICKPVYPYFLQSGGIIIVDHYHYASVLFYFVILKKYR